MEESLYVRADKQVVSLLTINFWSSLVCIVLLAAINLINLFRGGFSAAAYVADGGYGSLFSPRLLLLLSVGCMVWLGIRAIAARRVKRRMEAVFLRVENGAVSGVSLAAPSASSSAYPDGRPFTIDIGDIREISLRDVQVIHKQQAQALIIKTEGDTYVVPGLAQIAAVRDSLADLLQGFSASK